MMLMPSDRSLFLKRTVHAIRHNRTCRSKSRLDQQRRDDHTVVVTMRSTLQATGIHVLLPANVAVCTQVHAAEAFSRSTAVSMPCLMGHRPKALTDGGIRDPNRNYGTPMEGVITVVDE
jgi:hypothetical protein